MCQSADLSHMRITYVQFETDYVVESTLSMNEDLLNAKYKDKLEPTYKVRWMCYFNL